MKPCEESLEYWKERAESAEAALACAVNALEDECICIPESKFPENRECDPCKALSQSAIVKFRQHLEKKK